MSDQAIDLTRLADLRSRAASRLSGAAAAKGSTTRAADALAVLYAWASSPDTAPDALTLLHELQVHQVELDLQDQELREKRAELEAELRRQAERYDNQPVGCFTLDRRLVVQELNRAGAAMLGVEREHACGLSLNHFLCPDSGPRLEALVSSCVEPGQQASGLLRLNPRVGPERPVRADIGVDVAVPRYFVVLTDCAGAA